MTVMHSYDPPERFVAGTVGEPGQRTFFLQARAGRRLTSVALEKGQVAALAERLEQLLDQVEAGGAVVSPAGAPDNGPLDQPIEEEFRVGTMTLSWEPESARVVVEVFPLAEGGEDDDEDEDPEPSEPSELLVVRIDASAARAFVRRAESVVAAGRPSCPFCGGPLDPSGHLCPRANGFRRTRS